MSYHNEPKSYLVLKQENIRGVDELTDYDYFIVHHVSELSIYGREEFLARYRNFEHIFNLYCLKPDEELRFNNGRWVKIFESNEAGPRAETCREAFNIEARDTKEYLPVQIKGNHQVPLVVYKYYYFAEPETIPQADVKCEVIDIKDIQILYRHGFNIPAINQGG